jgi:hypothetical protein
MAIRPYIFTEETRFLCLGDKKSDRPPKISFVVKTLVLPTLAPSQGDLETGFLFGFSQLTVMATVETRFLCLGDKKSDRPPKKTSFVSFDFSLTNPRAPQKSDRPPKKTSFDRSDFSLTNPIHLL